MSDAEKCRENGWQVGDVLEGADHYGTTRIVLTAIGERMILARAIWRNEEIKLEYQREGHWTLNFRDWRKI